MKENIINKIKDPFEELFIDEHGNVIDKQIVYKENPSPEQIKINEIYSIVAAMYRRNMFEADSRFFGYAGAIGFKVDPSLFGFCEPTLQKCLSILHEKISIDELGLSEIKDLLQNLVEAIEKFDPTDTEYLNEDFQKEFTKDDAIFLKNFQAVIKALIKKY